MYEYGLSFSFTYMEEEQKTCINKLQLTNIEDAHLKHPRELRNTLKLREYDKWCGLGLHGKGADLPNLSAIAFADDVTLISKDTNSTRALIDIAENHLASIGLHQNKIRQNEVRNIMEENFRCGRYRFHEEYNIESRQTAIMVSTTTDDGPEIKALDTGIYITQHHIISLHFILIYVFPESSKNQHCKNFREKTRHQTLSAKSVILLVTSVMSMTRSKHNGDASGFRLRADFMRKSNTKYLLVL
ncbi:hypothetical protein C0J52_17666 [Blattella germanica]|nr:hypothetical protein C0J52_17666 [Blattella germanica]